MKIKVTASSGQVGYFENDVFFFNGIPRTQFGIGYELRHPNENFGCDDDNPFYILEWTLGAIDILVITGYTSKICIIPVSNLIVIQSFDIKINKDGNIQHFKPDQDKRWVILVINPDGSIHHKIKHPKYVYNRSSVPSDTFLPKNKLEELMATNKSPIENFGYIKFDKDKNSLIIGVDFHYDWYQERLYNAETQEWGEIVSAGRY